VAKLLQALRYKAEGRGFDTGWGQGDYGSGADAASNRNEHQGYLMGTKAAGAEGWQCCHLPVPIVCSIQDGPVDGLDRRVTLYWKCNNLQGAWASSVGLVT